MAITFAIVAIIIIIYLWKIRKHADPENLCVLTMKFEIFIRHLHGDVNR